MQEVKSGEAAYFGKHIVQCNALDNGDTELLVLPTGRGHVHVRFAKEPYACTLLLANGERKDIHLADTEDWGNIQSCTPDDREEWKEKVGSGFYWRDATGWGNDRDGHIPIEEVRDELDRLIPLQVFRHDVADLLAYHADN